MVLGAIAFADMLCEGAAADWAAVYLRGSLDAVPLVAGLAYTGYALAMVTVRLSGNRLLTRFAGNHLLPVLAGVATVGFASCLAIDRRRACWWGSPSWAAGWDVWCPPS